MLILEVAVGLAPPDVIVLDGEIIDMEVLISVEDLIEFMLMVSYLRRLNLLDIYREWTSLARGQNECIY